MIAVNDIQTELIQLVYVSAAAVEFTEADLDALLVGARQTNTSLDVTGILLFTEGTFFQVLEGVEEVVQPLYEKIETDERHTNALVLSKSTIEGRNFGDWNMGFVADREQISNLEGFNDFFVNGGRSFMDLQGDSKRIGQVLQGFERGRWRREASVSQA